MATTPPTELAIWSKRPEGLPKKTFSAYWPIWAMVTGVSAPPANRWFAMLPMSTSKAAELERPLPLSTAEVV